MNVIITKEEILNTPNNMELGALVRNKFWQEERNQRGPQFDDEQFIIIADENGLVTKISRGDEIFETCILCGKVTDILIDTDINYRYGYVEGAGQCCKECFEKK